MEQLEIYVRVDLFAIIERVDQAFNIGPSQTGVKVVSVKFAENYKKWLCVVPVGFTAGFKAIIKDMEGVYVNQPPPDIQPDNA